MMSTVRPTTRVACAQLAPVIADPAANRTLAQRAIGEAVDEGAKVIVLPELMTTGYLLTPAEAATLAEDASGPSIRSWITSLQGSDAIVVGGFCERGADGATYNSAAMVSADGVLAVYRKAHLWAKEPELFSPGAEFPPVVMTRWGPIAVGICYDLFFPEVIRGVALRGAHLLAIPTASPWDGPRPAESQVPPDSIGHIVARTAAYLNRIHIAVCDRHGDERGMGWNSRSSVIGPEGQFLAGPAPYAEYLLLADCDLAEAENKVWDGTDNDALADRRPELYGEISAAVV